MSSSWWDIKSPQGKWNHFSPPPQTSILFFCVLTDSKEAHQPAHSSFTDQQQHNIKALWRKNKIIWIIWVSSRYWTKVGNTNWATETFVCVSFNIIWLTSRFLGKLTETSETSLLLKSTCGNSEVQRALYWTFLCSSWFFVVYIHLKSKFNTYELSF